MGQAHGRGPHGPVFRPGPRIHEDAAYLASAFAALAVAERKWLRARGEEGDPDDATAESSTETPTEEEGDSEAEASLDDLPRRALRARRHRARVRRLMQRLTTAWRILRERMTAFVGRHTELADYELADNATEVWWGPRNPPPVMNQVEVFWGSVHNARRNAVLIYVLVSVSGPSLRRLVPLRDVLYGMRSWGRANDAWVHDVAFHLDRGRVIKYMVPDDGAPNYRYVRKLGKTLVNSPQPRLGATVLYDPWNPALRGPLDRHGRDYELSYGESAPLPNDRGYAPHDMRDDFDRIMGED